jgi:hypothetical protein
MTAPSASGLQLRREPPQCVPDLAADRGRQHLVLSSRYDSLGTRRRGRLGVARAPAEGVDEAARRDRPQPADRRAADRRAGERAGRPPHRQIRLLHDLGDDLLVRAAASQPDRHPRRRPPVQLLERGAVAFGDKADEPFLVRLRQRSLS